MADPRFPAGGPDDQDRALESILGPPLVARLHGLLRAVRIYDLSNQAVRDQLRETLALIEQAMEDEVTMVAMGQCFYVNGVRVRAEASQIPLFGSLSSEFERRRLGGVRFLPGLGADELGLFMRLLSNHPEAGADFAQLASGAGLLHIVPISAAELESMQEAPAADTDGTERGRAKVTFQHALHGGKSAILRTARTGRPAIRRAKRAIQPIVDSILKNEHSIVSLTAIKNHDEYTYAHCVNVSILSVSIGQALGLSRAVLANLGVAALLHDVGKLAIPIQVLRKNGALSAEDWGLMRRHPFEGVKVAARMPGLSPLLLDALHVTLYHHRRFERGGYPEVARPGPPPPVARIVSAADCYDAMTAHRIYRARPFTGYEALSVLLGHESSHFDPAVLWGLVQTVGLYPAGTILETKSRHIVLSLNSNRRDLKRPHCQVLAYPGRRNALEGRPEYWQPMPPHESVARVVPPEEFGVGIDRLLAA